MARIVVLRRPLRAAIGGALLLWWPAAAGLAQVPVDPSNGGNNTQSGVVHPHDHLDPGIAKPAPAMSPQSTPVIRPPGTRPGRHGKVLVVPK